MTRVYAPGDMVFYRGQRMKVASVEANPIDGDTLTLEHRMQLAALNCPRCHGKGESLVPKPRDPTLLTYGMCPACHGVGVIAGRTRTLTTTVAVADLDDPPGRYYRQSRIDGRKES